jgi:hypothetical protein
VHTPVLNATTRHYQTKRSTNIYVDHAKNPNEKVEENAHIHLVGWEWEEVGVFITFAIFVFAVGYAKVGKKNGNIKINIGVLIALKFSSLPPHALFGGLFPRIFVIIRYDIHKK